MIGPIQQSGSLQLGGGLQRSDALHGAGASGISSDPLGPATTAEARTGGFAAALGSAASGAVETLRTAESAAAQGLAGTLSTREVVDRVMEAERTLRGAVAMRDKIVAGWLDISRMQI